MTAAVAAYAAGGCVWVASSAIYAWKGGGHSWPRDRRDALRRLGHALAIAVHAVIWPISMIFAAMGD